MHQDQLVFNEHNLDVNQILDYSVYGKTKFEAEKLVNEARRNGVQATIYRLGNILGRSDDGVFQDNIESNRFYNNLKAFIRLGKVSESISRSTISGTPVDICAKWVVKIVLIEGSSGINYHVDNNMEIQKIIDCLNSQKIKIVVVGDQEFSSYLDSYIKNEKFEMEISFIYHQLNNSDNSRSQYVNYKIPFIDTSFANRVLSRLKIPIYNYDINYIKKLVQHSEYRFLKLHQINQETSN